MLMMKRLLTIFACLILILTGSAHAEDLYVCSTGAGATDGSDWDNCFNGFADISWGTGAGSVGPGDTLYIDGGSTSSTYTSKLTVGDDGESGNLIYIKPGSASPSPSNHDGTVIIERTDNSDDGIDVNRDYITIDGNDGNGNRKIKIQNARMSIYGINRDHVVIRYVHTDNSNATNGWSSIRLSQSTNCIVEHCLIENGHEGCVTISGATGDWGTKIIRYNECYEYNLDGFAIDSGTDVYGNKIQFKGTSTAGHPDGIVLQGSRNRVWANEIIGFNQNIYVDSISEANPENKIWSNLIYWVSGGLDISDFASGINCHNETYNGTIWIYNNTVIDTYIRVQGPQTAYIKNNITDTGLRIDSNSATVEIDYNWHTLTRQTNFGYNGSTYTNYNNWLTAIRADTPSVDLNSGSGDAGFVNEAGDDFRVDADSDCYDAGTDLGSDYETGLSALSFPSPTTTTRPQGLGWDIGAYEYTSQTNTIQGITIGYQHEDRRLEMLESKRA